MNKSFVPEPISCFRILYVYFIHPYTWVCNITDADDADALALLANTPTQVESLLHSLKRGGWVGGCIGLYVSTNKTEYMCFNREGSISTLKGGPLKLVDKLTYLDSSVSSTESDVSIRLGKAWTAIDKLSIIRKCDLSDKIKQDSFQVAAVSLYCWDIFAISDLRSVSPKPKLHDI